MTNEGIFWTVMTCFFIVLIARDFIGDNEDQVTKRYISGILVLFFFAIFCASECLFLANSTIGV